MPDKIEDNALLVKSTVQGVMAEMAALESAKKTKEEAEVKLREEIRAEEKEKLEAEQETWLAKKGIASRKVLTEDKTEGEGHRAFLHYLRTGDEIVARKALQEGTESEGGYLTPEDSLSGIVSKRDERSFLRKTGVQIFQTNRDVFNAPTESTKFSVVDVVAEEGSANSTDPAYGQVAITVHRFPTITRVSVELLEDNDVGLTSWLNRRFGDIWALTECYYAAVGSGSGQPEGVFEGGDTDALTFDCTGDIKPQEIPELLYKLNDGYRSQPSTAWLMKGSTEAALRGIRDANNFAFPAGPISDGNGWSMRGLSGIPVYNNSNVPAIAAGAGVICVGDFSYYGLVERGSLTIQRLNELYAANGQIGFLSVFRFGGAVLQEEAFAIGQMASS